MNRSTIQILAGAAVLVGIFFAVAAPTASAGAPGTPGTPSVTSTTQTSISISWSSSSCCSGGAILATYIVEWISTCPGTPSSGSSADTGGTATTYTISGLAAVTCYSIDVYAMNSDGQVSPRSGVAQGTTDGYPPGAPGTPTVTGTTTTTVSITWALGAPGSGANTAQHVRWFIAPNSDVMSSAISPTATSYTIQGLPSGTNIQQIRIRAVNDYGYTEGGSTSATTQVQPAPPDTPMGPYLVSSTRTSQTVGWDEPDAHGATITSYTLYYGTTNGGPYSTVTQSARTRLFTGLTANTHYYYKVSATNSVGTSGVSAQADLVTKSCDAPGAPTGLIVTSTTTTSVSLSWTAPADNGGSPITAYLVKRGTSSGSYPTTINTASAATSYTVTGLTTGTTYYFVVAAQSSGCATPNGTNSAEVSAAAVNSDTTPPGPITNVVLTPNYDAETQDTYIRVTYTLPTDVDFNHLSVSFNGGSDVPYGTSANPVQGPYAGTTFYLDNLESAKTYYVRVRVFDNAGNYREQGPFSATTPDTSAPATPSSFAGTTGQTYVALSWAANGESDMARFLLYRAEGTSAYGFALFANLTSSTLAYNDTAVIGGHTYHYFLRAQDTAWNIGPYTATLDLLVPVDDDPPGVVHDFTATGSDHVVHLHWTMSDAEDLDHYVLTRGTFPVFNLAQLATPGASNATFDDYSVENGTTYGYRIAAVDHSGNVGAYTDPMVIATPGATAQVQSAAAAQADNIWGLAVLLLGVSVIVGILMTLQSKINGGR